jgi:hypothetical protein
MYVRTTDGLGQGQESWSAPQDLSRVILRPVPIGYLVTTNLFPPRGGCPVERIVVC